MPDSMLWGKNASPKRADITGDEVGGYGDLIGPQCDLSLVSSRNESQCSCRRRLFLSSAQDWLESKGQIEKLSASGLGPATSPTRQSRQRLKWHQIKHLVSRKTPCHPGFDLCRLWGRSLHNTRSILALPIPMLGLRDVSSWIGTPRRRGKGLVTFHRSIYLMVRKVGPSCMTE